MPPDGLSTAELLDALALPTDGRMLTFGSASAQLGLDIAVARTDVLIVICDTTSEVTPEVAERTLADRIDNVVVGDTPAGPLVDRALCVDSLHSMSPRDMITLRSAMLPAGYAIFLEREVPTTTIVTKLKETGFEVADEMGDIAEFHAVRAR